MTDDELCTDVHVNLCYAIDCLNWHHDRMTTINNAVKRRLEGSGITNNELRREGSKLRYTARKLRELADYIDTTAEMLESL